MVHSAASLSEPASPYVFSTPDGYALCRRIILKQLGFDPHDYQLEGVCRALDGFDLLAVTPTGSGKTGFLSMYLLVMHAVMADSSLCKNAPPHFRRDGSIVVVCPTKSLELDMEPKFRSAGLSTLVINQNTVDAARLRGGDIWDSAPAVNVLLLGPEQLTSKGFETLLKDKGYQSRVVALGVDEVHLLNTWGQSFRKSFTYIGTARMRFHHSPILIALTATLRTGFPYDSVCKFLGLHPGKFHTIRRSNQRHDVRLLFRTVQSSARAYRFPELDWVLTERRRVIVFCRTIALTFRVAMYLRVRGEGAVGDEDVETQVRTYTALNWDTYNSVTLDLMHQDSRLSWVTVATDTLSVGIDVRNTDDVVLYDFQLPMDTDSVLQKAGRIRDGRAKNSKVVVYLPKNAVDVASKALAYVAEGSPETVVKVGKGKHPTMVDVGVARLVTATCKVDALDVLYDNPPLDLPCSCRTCTEAPPASRPTACNCSGCEPELVAADSDVEDTAVEKSKQRRKKVPANEVITKKMRKHAPCAFHAFRKSERDAAEDWDMLPAEEIVPDDVVKTLLDHFYELLDERALVNLIHLPDHPSLDLRRCRLLFGIVQKLRGEFDDMRTKAKIAKAAKAAQTRAKKKAEKEAQAALAHPDPTGAPATVAGQEMIVTAGGGSASALADEGDNDEVDSDGELLESEDEDEDALGTAAREADQADSQNPPVVAHIARIVIPVKGSGLARLRIPGGRFGQGP